MPTPTLNLDMRYEIALHLTPETFYNFLAADPCLYALLSHQRQYRTPINRRLTLLESSMKTKYTLAVAAADLDHGRITALTAPYPHLRHFGISHSFYLNIFVHFSIGVIVAKKDRDLEEPLPSGFEGMTGVLRQAIERKEVLGLPVEGLRVVEELVEGIGREGAEYVAWRKVKARFGDAGRRDGGSRRAFFRLESKKG